MAKVIVIKKRDHFNKVRCQKISVFCIRVRLELDKKEVVNLEILTFAVVVLVDFLARDLLE